MARRVRDSSLETRAARAKLKVSGKPYYKVVGPGLHVGYRKGQRGGKWVVRRYVGNETYVVETIAEADDYADANGSQFLSFWQAQDRARKLAGVRAAGNLKVKDAIADYLDVLEGRASVEHVHVHGLSLGTSSTKREGVERTMEVQPHALRHAASATLRCNDSKRHGVPRASDAQWSLSHAWGQVTWGA